MAAVEATDIKVTMAPAVAATATKKVARHFNTDRQRASKRKRGHNGTV